mmetsp:Transcript_70032/g.204913  ORF Transcript_70032/g.204913 Transcript_70032/m.204913 type:complete len:342 (-) Transcript_70032:92-1117(-)
MALRPVPQGPLHQHSSPATSDLAALAQHPRGEERAPRRLGPAAGALPASPARERPPQQAHPRELAEGLAWRRGRRLRRDPRAAGAQAGEQLLGDVDGHGEHGREVRQRPGADPPVLSSCRVGEEPVDGEVRDAARVQQRRAPLGERPVLLPEPALAGRVGRQQVRLVRGHARDARPVVVEAEEVALVLLQVDGPGIVAAGDADHRLAAPDPHDVLLALPAGLRAERHRELPRAVLVAELHGAHREAGLQLQRVGQDDVRGLPGRELAVGEAEDVHLTLACKSQTPLVCGLPWVKGCKCYHHRLVQLDVHLQAFELRRPVELAPIPQAMLVAHAAAHVAAAD